MGLGTPNPKFTRSQKAVTDWSTVGPGLVAATNRDMSGAPYP